MYFELMCVFDQDGCVHSEWKNGVNRKSSRTPFQVQKFSSELRSHIDWDGLFFSSDALWQGYLFQHQSILWLFQSEIHEKKALQVFFPL